MQIPVLPIQDLQIGKTYNQKKRPCADQQDFKLLKMLHVSIKKIKLDILSKIKYNIHIKN